MTLETLLGPKLLSGDEEIATQSLSSKKNVVLYFSAHWCPPCRGFTPIFSKSFQDYKEKNGGNVDTEVIFVSSDSDKQAFDEYRAEMSFLALPFDSGKSQELGEKFGIEGIPSIVAIDSDGNVVGENLDFRSQVAVHGAGAFPLTEERAKELEKEQENMKVEALKKLYDGSISFQAKDSSDSAKTESLKELLSANEHVAFLLGDGDVSDRMYEAVKETFGEVSKEKTDRCKVVYVGWSLYNSESNHETLGKKFDYSLVVDDSTPELRSGINNILGGQGNAGTLLVLRPGSGLCDMKGNCEALGEPVIVCTDIGLRKMGTTGAPAFPWDETAIKTFEEAKQARLNVTKNKMKDMNAFLKSVKLLGGPNNDGWKDIEDDNAVIGLYFSAHWCPPCKMFTPKLVSVYEEIKNSGKPFEIVFLSSDSSKTEFESYFESMKTGGGNQYYALDYDNRDLKANLSKLFEVEGIPTLVFLKKDGSILSRDGREAILTGGKDSDVFPWNG